MLSVFVGTSGWVYDWNVGGSLEWYVEESGLNAVELNASFYRFPFRTQIMGWCRRGRGLRWAVKVHRSITHMRKLSEEALSTWLKFSKLFEPLDRSVDFYLFQLPPNLTCREGSLDRVRRFYERTGLGERFAVEFRHPTCFTNEVIKWGGRLGLTLVSVDSPIASWVVKSNRSIYLRLHGREGWYSYDYNVSELERLAEEVLNLGPEKIYVFFNNDHWMLENARVMLNILTSRRT